MVDDRRKLLMLDFDGTICRGDAAVHDYAQSLAAGLDANAARRLRDDLDAFLTHGHRSAIPDARDGYDAVTLLGMRAGLDRERVLDAFLTTRRRLTSGELPIEVPINLASFLHDISVNAHIVVVTNAPINGLSAIIERMGVSEILDGSIGDAGKPDSMPALVERLLDDIDAGQAPWRLLSAGDIWENDLQGPSERGCVTAYVDRFGLGHGQPNVTASTLEGVYDPIRRWAGEMSDDALSRVVYPHLSAL